eukprot:800816-Pelagomonas_calceolata.AAC.1
MARQQHLCYNKAIGEEQHWLDTTMSNSNHCYGFPQTCNTHGCIVFQRFWIGLPGGLEQSE